VGQFTVDPVEAVVKPGCKQQVSVVFRAEANRAWAATLGLDISGRDPRDQHNGIPYELGGDSCIPGEDVLQQIEIATMRHKRHRSQTYPSRDTLQTPAA
jgi:hypothetical protein